MKYNPFRKKEGFKRLFPLYLTVNQKIMINDYCLNQGYYLDTDKQIPYICYGKKRLPIQLVNGKLSCIEREKSYDLYELSKQCNMMKVINKKYNTNHYRVKDVRMNDYLIKGTGILNLEI